MLKQLFLSTVLLLTGVLGADNLDLTDAAWQLTLGNEFPGAKAGLTRGPQQQLSLTSDFSGGGNYTGITLGLKPQLDLQSLEFDLKTSAHSIGVQVVDSAKQTFVSFLPLSGNVDTIQRIRVENFYDAEKRNGAKWGGPNDGVVRPPFSSIMLRILADSYANGNAKVEFLRIAGNRRETPAPAGSGVTVIPKPEEWRLNLGPEFPGAAGKATPLPNGLRVDSDFSGGGNYIGAALEFPRGIDAVSMQFQIKTPLSKLLAEVIDSTGQTVYQTIELSGDGKERQNVVIKTFSPKNAEHWGGAGDGMIHLPIRQIRLRWLIALKPELKQFPVELTDVRIQANSLPAAAAPEKSSAASQIVIADPSALFVEPGTKTLTFTLNADTPLKVADYEWLDYNGAVVASGRAPVSGRNVTPALPDAPGFYECRIPAFQFFGGVAVLPRFTGDRDPFFAMDAGCSVFGLYRNESLADAYFRILKYGGVSSVRERMIWKELEADGPGKFKWQIHGNAETLRKLAAGNDLKVLELFHDAPAHLGAKSDRKASGYYPFARNLIGAADSWRAIAGRWGSLWNALEVWNEPEISFGAGLPGDQLGALQRTISREFSAAGIRIPLVSGVFTGSVINDRMMRLYLENGLLADADIFSFHSYDDAPRLQRKIAEYRQSFRNDPRQGIPVWITECGKPWPRGTDRAGCADDINSAKHIAMKAVEAKANGVAMFYPFIFQYYDENSNNFGMMDRNHTPMRSLAGYLNTVRLLSGFRYAGDLNQATGAELTRVFLRGNDAVIALYGDADITLPEGLEITRVEGLDGRPLPREKTYKLRDGLFFAITAAAAIKPFLNTDTEAMRLLNMAEAYQPSPREAKPVVMQFDFDRPTTSWTLYGYLFEDSHQAKIPILFNNLDDKPLTVKPRLTLPPGAELSGTLPETLELPPRQAVMLAFTVNLAGALAQTPETAIKLEDAAGHAALLLIGVRDWNLEKADALPGLAADTPDKVDAVGTDWVKLDNISRWKKWDGGHVPNIRAAFRAGYTPETLRITVLVEDPKFHQPYAADMAWKADSIQIALQTLSADNQRKETFTEITAAQTPGGPKIYMHSHESGNLPRGGGLLKASKLEFVKLPGGMLYRIDLDAKEMGVKEFKRGTGFGFALLVNSSEGKQRDGYLYWGDGIGEYKNAREFNTLRL